MPRRRRALRLETLETRYALAGAVTVNVLGDAPDADPQDGVCDIDLATPGLQATLAAATQCLNADGGGTLTMAVSGVFSDATFTQPVNIDGDNHTLNFGAGTGLTLAAGGGVEELNIVGGGLHFTGSGGTLQNNSLVGGSGLVVVGHNNLIKSNALFESESHGLVVRGANNRIEANLIGAEGTTDRGHAGHGIWIDGTTVAADHNLVINNLISGNGQHGVAIVGSLATFTRVEGNRIGTNAAGTGALGNGGSGVRIENVADTSIGAADAAAGNIIAANQIGISTAGLVPRTVLHNNRIGLNFNGAALGNSSHGVQIEAPAGGERNDVTIRNSTISANGGDGVRIESSGVKVFGNLIGTSGDGTAARGNLGHGIHITGQTGDNGDFNVIGTTTGGNVISANALAGIRVAGDDNTVINNVIGLSSASNAKLANQHGILIVGARNKIGDTADGTGNVIAGNTQLGVHVQAGSTDTQLVRNVIGTNRSDAQNLGNGASGVFVENATKTFVGKAGLPNLISGNAGHGVWITGALATLNEVRGSIIGLDLQSRALPNQLGGVTIDAGASQTIVGGAAANERNFISGNLTHGLAIRGANNNAVQNNFIGPAVGGQNRPSGSQQPVGVLIEGGAQNNVIGFATSGVGNLISGNSGPGIIIRGAGTSQNKAGANVIGLGANLQATLSNTIGVAIRDGAASNLIGGAVASALNIVAGNTSHGVHLATGATLNEVKLNSIGVHPTNGQVFGNGGHGVFLDNVTNNLIGDPTGGAGNSIRGHAQGAVRVGTGSTANRILSNGISGNSGGGIIGPQFVALPSQPVIRQVTRSGTNVTVVVQVVAAAGSTVRLDIFASQQPHGSDFGEGQLPVNAGTIVMPAAGVAQVQFQFTIPNESFAHFTATLTDATNTTYDFSRAITTGHRASVVDSLVTSGPVNDIQPILLTATLLGDQGVPTGEVEFYDGLTRIGQAPINAQGQATFGALIGTQGLHNIYAVYKGSDSFAGSISAPLAITVVAGPPNQLPVAAADHPTVMEDGSVAIHVLGNDFDPDGTIITTSVTIVQAPAHGTATVNPATGVITYTPDNNYDGPDLLKYTIRDNRNGTSLPGNVNITVTDIPEPYHNKPRPLDVDNDGFITPTDAALVINRLNGTGGGVLPPPTIPPTAFYDTTGDNILAPLDALLVINRLNAGGGGEAETEEPVDPVAGERAALDAVLEAWLLLDRLEGSSRTQRKR